MFLSDPTSTKTIHKTQFVIRNSRDSGPLSSRIKKAQSKRTRLIFYDDQKIIYCKINRWVSTLLPNSS